MGYLVYSDARVSIQIDDRALAHVRIAIGAKLRRDEPFFLSWADAPSVGRSSIWIAQGIPLVFSIEHARVGAINPEWVRALEASASTPAGLRLLPEPGAGSDHEHSASVHTRGPLEKTAG